MNRSISFTIKNSFDNVSLATSSINKILAEEAFNESFCYDIELCMAEVLNNCIEHAYNGVEENTKEIKVFFELSDSKLLFRVEDFGSKKEEIESIEFDFSFDDIENLPEGGFGLSIISQIMDKVDYIFEDNKNITILEKNYIREG